MLLCILFEVVSIFHLSHVERALKSKSDAIITAH